jgi:uncharacterized protein YbjQ (UPF0145 family)
MAGQGGGAWGSVLSTAEFAAVEGAGFDPVGQVLGTTVYQMGYFGNNWCRGAWSGTVSATDVSSSRWAPFAAFVQTMYEARRTALGRAVSECGARGGDGVVGVRVRVGPFPSGGLEFTAVGTAVRARSRTRPARPFTSHLGGQDFARLVHAGWMPTGLAFGISVATRHDDRRTRRQTRWLAGNQEIDGYTELVARARHDARARLAADAAPNGGDGVVVDEMELTVRERECGGTVDHIVEAVFAGTSIVRYSRPGRRTGPRPLTIMRLERES